MSGGFFTHLGTAIGLLLPGEGVAGCTTQFPTQRAALKVHGAVGGGRMGDCRGGIQSHPRNSPTLSSADKEMTCQMGLYVIIAIRAELDPSIRFSKRLCPVSDGLERTSCYGCFLKSQAQSVVPAFSKSVLFTILSPRFEVSICQTKFVGGCKG